MLKSFALLNEVDSFTKHCDVDTREAILVREQLCCVVVGSGFIEQAKGFESIGCERLKRKFCC